MGSKLQKTSAAVDTTVKLLSILCPLIYFASYLTRKNYGVIMTAIIENEGMADDVAGFIETLALISYGAGQVISGILGDKFKPQNIIVCGLSTTIACNLLMPLCPYNYLREIVWFINGFAQSMLWPPLVRIMAETMDSRTYSRVCANVNVAGIGGTIFLYLSYPLIWQKLFGVNGWRATFFSSAVLCGVVLTVWLFGLRAIRSDERISFNKRKREEAANEAGGKKLSLRLILGSGFVLIALGIILQGMLRDGITDWDPKMISDTFGITADKAILKAVILPVIGVVSLKLVGFINERFVKDEVRAAGLTFVMALACLTTLFFFHDKNEYLTLALSAVSVGLMHAINFFLICIVPLKFEKFGVVSTMSGVINSLTYVGSAAALYGFGFISETTGNNWRIVIGAWAMIAALGVAMCFAAIRPWKKFQTEE
ncbi:MAG: MFS transporter [Clostridia bacterium]|nr:MFS transporter [Clostridia bacterium]